MTTTPTIDQAQAVYAAEDLWEKEEPQARIRFGDWHEIQPFYARLAAMLRDAGEDVLPPTVYPRRGALKAHYDATTSAVYIPPYDRGGVWALVTSTAIHEFAHHLTPGAGHGPAFRAAMIQCLEVMGWNAELLADCYAQAGLSTSDKVDGITDKVARLITHAEGRGRTLEEKKTFLEKAERMAAENSINLALLRKRQADADGEGKNGRDRPMTGKMFSLTALANVTYRNLAVELGSAIGRAHGAECAIRGKSQWMTFYGFPEDVHLTELMLTRVTPMMFEAADEYLKSAEHRVSGVASVSARITFCKNFAWEVGSRLKEAVKQAERVVVETLELTDGNASASTELVLRDKAVEVRDYVAHEFRRQGVRGSWKGSNTNSWSNGAADAGRSAAKSANLYGRKELGS